MGSSFCVRVFSTRSLRSAEAEGAFERETPEARVHQALRVVLLAFSTRPFVSFRPKFRFPYESPELSYAKRGRWGVRRRALSVSSGLFRLSSGIDRIRTKERSFDFPSPFVFRRKSGASSCCWRKGLRKSFFGRWKGMGAKL